MAKAKDKKKELRIEVRNIQDVQRSLKDLGNTARKSRQPGLFVGPIVRKTTPIRIKGGDSRNLPAMQIKGNKIQDARPNVFEATATKMETQIYLQAEKDLDNLVNKMIKQAGF